MADKNFEVRKGLTVGNNIIITSGSNVGISNTAPTHTLSINGNMFVNTSITLNTQLIANTLGLYHTGTINTASFTIGSSVTANTTRLVLASAVGLSANGTLGSNGQVLTSNATAVYWSTISSGGSNTHVLFNDSSQSNGSANFTFNKSSNTLTISSNTLTISGTMSTAGANEVSQTLSDGATISWNTASGRIATVTLGGNRTIGAPTNLKVGSYILHVLQDATGSRTLTWNAVFKWPAGVAPVLTTTASRRDTFSFISDGTNLYGSYINDVR
jgi:hypothetical protein